MVGTPVEWAQFIKDIGLPFSALFGLLIVVYRVSMAAIKAYREDRVASREAQSQDAKLQTALLDRYAQAVQAIATNTAAIVSNTAEIVGVRTDIPRELNATFEKAQKDREQITTTVKAHVTEVIQPVAAGVTELSGKVATRDDVAQLATVAGVTKAESAAERDAHRDEITKLSDAYRALATKIDGLPEAIADALRPILDGHVKAMRDFIEKASPSPVVVVTPPATLPEPLPAAPAADAARVTVTEAKA